MSLRIRASRFQGCEESWVVLMHSLFFRVAFWAVLLLHCTSTSAETIDPEVYISKNGYQSDMLGDDGKTRFYSFSERATPTRIAILESGIARLPKHTEIQKVCDFMRGGVKAGLIEQRGIAVDVAVTNYGYEGPIVSCVLKYMYKNEVGTQLLYSKKGTSVMYTVFITN